MVKKNDRIANLSYLFFLISIFIAVSTGILLNPYFIHAVLIAIFIFLVGLLQSVLIILIFQKKQHKYEIEHGFVAKPEPMINSMIQIHSDMLHSNLQSLTTLFLEIMPDAKIITDSCKTIWENSVYVSICDKKNEIVIDFNNQGAFITINDESDYPMNFEVAFKIPFILLTFYEEVFESINKWIKTINFSSLLKQGI